jgi:hypothetical protein
MKRRKNLLINNLVIDINDKIFLTTAIHCPD